jgi:hypothetical protein
MNDQSILARLLAGINADPRYNTMNGFQGAQHQGGKPLTPGEAASVLDFGGLNALQRLFGAGVPDQVWLNESHGMAKRGK